MPQNDNRLAARGSRSGPRASAREVGRCPAGHSAAVSRQRCRRQAIVVLRRLRPSAASAIDRRHSGCRGTAHTHSQRANQLPQKNYNSLYLMGAYQTSNGEYTTPFPRKLLADAFKKAGKRLDMGKCCLHFKQLADLELTSVAKVIGMSTPKEYLAYYKRVKGLA